MACMSQYMITLWHAPGVHAAGTAYAGEASFACGQPVELRRLQG